MNKVAVRVGLVRWSMPRVVQCESGLTKQKVVCLARDDDGLKLGSPLNNRKRVTSKIVRW